MIDFRCMDVKTAIRLVAWLIGHIGAVAVALGLAWHEPPEIFYSVVGVLLYMTIITVRAIYKNNPTSPFGVLCQRVKEKSEEVGVEAVLEAILLAIPEAEEFGADEEGLEEEGEE